MTYVLGLANNSTHDPAATGHLPGGRHRPALRRRSTHNPERDPSDWVTGGEPSTGPQESYIRTLAKEAGEEVPTGLSKAEASETIDRLQQGTGRG